MNWFVGDKVYIKDWSPIVATVMRQYDNNLYLVQLFTHNQECINILVNGNELQLVRRKNGLRHVAERMSLV